MKGLEGYDKIENVLTFFVETSALKRGEYGNVFYASMGTKPSNKAQKITVKSEVEQVSSMNQEADGLIRG